MPHLSPLSWALLPIMFWLTLALIISTFWWHQAPVLPQLNKSTKLTETTWEWKCPNSN